MTECFNWRDHLAVHPAADLFPLMSEADLKELADDIQKKDGLNVPIVICTPLSRKHFFETRWRKRESLETKKKREAKRKTWKLLDGRNRLDALAEITKRALLEKEQLGEKFGTLGGGIFLDDHIFLTIDEEGELCLYDAPIRETCRSDELVVAHYDVDDEEARALAASYNEHRRHLTAEQRRDIIAKRLKAAPEKSNNQIAKEVKADDKTVAKVRDDLESTSEIPKLEKTVGADGKARKRRKESHAQSHHAAAAERGKQAWAALTARWIKDHPGQTADDFDRVSSCSASDAEAEEYGRWMAPFFEQQARKQPSPEEVHERSRRRAEKKGAAIRATLKPEPEPSPEASTEARRAYYTEHEDDDVRGDGDTPEQIWYRGLAYRAGEAAAGAAYSNWEREYGNWSQFKVTPELIALTDQAIDSWQKLKAKLSELPQDKPASPSKPSAREAA